MNIVIFGASGKIGSRLVKTCLDKGHDVTAFVFGKNPFQETAGLTVISGDVHKYEDIEAAIKGKELVMSALGSWGTPTKDILSSAMSNLVPAMQKQGIRRIISLTGADARAIGDSNSAINKLFRPVLLIMAGKILKDGEKHIDLLENSQLDWTVIRSPVMKDVSSGKYKLTSERPMPWQTISREHVISAMIGQIDSQEFIRKAPFIVPTK